MVVMMNALNKTYFGGQQRVTCFTCHNGDPQPERSPSLRLQYSELVNDPSSFKFFPDVAAPPAEKILARYIEALGGAQRLAAFTSFVGTGTYLGFETSEQEVPLQVFARAPDQRTLIAETGATDLMWVHNGRNAWRYQPDTPIPLIELTGLEPHRFADRHDGVLSSGAPESVRAVAGGLRGYRRQAGRGGARHQPGAVSGQPALRRIRACWSAWCGGPKRQPALFPCRSTTPTTATWRA